MEKLSNRLQHILLILPTIVSFSFWYLGIDNDKTLNIFNHMAVYQYVIFSIIILLNVKKLMVSDWIMVIIAIFSSCFFVFTGSTRNVDSFEINIVISVILFLLISYKVRPLDKVDRLIFCGAIMIILFLTLYKLSVELPKVLTFEEFIENSNKLAKIWINVNTIGASILFSTMLSAILLKSFEKRYLNVLIIIIYILGFIGTWACQSRTSSIVLLVFLVLDNCLSKAFFQENRLWVAFYPLFFIVIPFIVYFLAESSSVDIFTGRENIWKNFFAQWLGDSSQVKIGMGPFTFSEKHLGTHNSFLYALSTFGITGYLLLFGTISYGISQLVRTEYYLTKLQVSSLFAFFAILVYSMMEDSLVIAPWIPVIFAFLGLAFSDFEPAET
ncbi:EpaQ family protein [Enterococcus sp. AZ109]|uniref:EpaQ family protein n=1 Tax=Enterococcus sp. AZ109 TaxID=2774634 RepID=UPI003F259C60